MARYSEKAKENLDEINQTIHDIVSNYMENPETLAELFEFSERFYKYSLNNRMLICAQNPYAEFVQSFKSWKKDGYSVKKGEKGIKILFPEMVTYIKTGDGQWMKLAKADEKTVQQYKNGELESRKVRYFGSGNVFDITQTTCPVEDYPKFYDMGYNDVDANTKYEAIVKYCNDCLETKVDVMDVKSVALRGVNFTKKQHIVLSDKLQDSERLSTLVHEMAHQQLHQDFSRYEKTTHQIEFEADAYAIMVNKRLDIQNTESRKRHVTNHYNKMVEELKEKGFEGNDIETYVKQVISNVFTTYDQTIDSIVSEVDRAVAQKGIDKEADKSKVIEKTIPKKSSKEMEL